jgi:hypothetical protein
MLSMLHSPVAVPSTYDGVNDKGVTLGFKRFALLHICTAGVQ